MDNAENQEAPQAAATVPTPDGAGTDALTSCTPSDAMAASATDPGCTVIKDPTKAGFSQIAPETPSHPTGKA